MKWKRNKKEKEMIHEAETDEIFEFSERLRIQTFEFGFRTPMLHF